VEVTNTLLPTCFFYDTLPLNNLTAEVYYRVRAVDLSFNNSKISEAILLLKPDTIAPVASVITGYEFKEEGLLLHWVNSQSEDLAGQGILRTNGVQQDTILYFVKGIDFVLDTSAHIGETYLYAIYSQDKAGNKSVCEPLSLTYELGYRAGVKQLTGSANRKDKKIALTWVIPNGLEVYSISIYKSKNGAPFQLCATLFESFSGYEDTELSPNNLYAYRIKVTYKSGHSSKMSAVVEVVY
jgi:hypothetical protein